MIYYLVGVVICLYVIHILLNCNKRARMLQKVPGPKRNFLVGNGLTILRSPVEIMKMGREFAKKYNGIYSIWVYPYGAVLVYNPKDIETVLSSMKYADKSIIYSLLQPWLGEGLLISNGIKWQERRKILTPTFHFNILKQFCEMLKENTELLIGNLNTTTGRAIDILPVLSEFTLNSICETAMGTKLSEDTTGAAKTYKQAITDLVLVLYQRFIRIYLYPDFLYNLTSLSRNQQKYLKTIHNFTESVIDNRKDYIEKNGFNINEVINDDDDDTYIYKKKRKTAMLDLLLSAHKEGLIDKVGIQEEVDTFMFEGHDTTAAGLTFCLMAIANHKNVQDKICDELTDIFGFSKRPIMMEDLNKMKYLECCIKEALRMYPPVHFISRSLNETTVLSNYTLPAGTLCHIPIFDLHYLDSEYEKPNKFDPDRFLPENSVGRHPYAYIPFSAGPRNCIGQRFAMMEMKIAVARILQEFELVPITRPKDICFIAHVVLRNNGPVLLKFIKKNQLKNHANVPT